MFRRWLPTLVISACAAACDRSVPPDDLPPPSPAQPQANEVSDGRLPIRVELTVSDADSQKRISAEIDRAFESHRNAKRVSEGGGWRIDVAACLITEFDPPRKDTGASTVRLAYELSANPPITDALRASDGRRVPSSRRGNIVCGLDELASRFSELIDTIERLDRLPPTAALRSGESDLFDDEDLRSPGRRSRDER